MCDLHATLSTLRHETALSPQILIVFSRKFYFAFDQMALIVFASTSPQGMIFKDFRSPFPVLGIPIKCMQNFPWACPWRCRPLFLYSSLDAGPFSDASPPPTLSRTFNLSDTPTGSSTPAETFPFCKFPLTTFLKPLCRFQIVHQV